MTNFLHLINYVYSMGFKWSLFRIKHLLRLKTDYFDNANKLINEKINSFELDHILLEIPRLSNTDYKSSDHSTQKADMAIKGKIFAFGHEFLDYNDQCRFNWHINPITKEKAPANISWNNIPDFSSIGDIKLIWEASRFSFVYYYINAFSVTKDQRYAVYCLNAIDDWCDRNPFPFGINYKCGQEIAFRLISWINALDYFSEFVDEKLRRKVLKNIYASLLRLELNIEFAAKSIKNNHSISEASGLIIGGLILKNIKESNIWVKKGVHYLENELAYQVYEDGSYIQHSMNYQRLALDTLSFVIFICQKSGFDLPDICLEAHKKMIKFLHSMIRADGLLPNYGNNDGALLFPLQQSQYNDFRSSINFASVVNEGKKLFDSNGELISFFYKDNFEIDQLEQEASFKTGGYYLVKDQKINIFTRCHSYKDRPGQNDILHLDIWYGNENVFLDTGTYSYYSDFPKLDNFKGTIGHNCFMINQSDQMIKVNQFGWAYWVKSRLLSHTTNSFEGMMDAYTSRFGVSLKRKFRVEDSSITVTDIAMGSFVRVTGSQIWNTLHNVSIIDNHTLHVGPCIIESNAPFHLEKSYVSNFYNHFEEGTKIIFEKTLTPNEQVETKIIFNQDRF